jgi:CDP-paratose 2-epimerase
VNHVLITGGAGFIGTNLTHRLLGLGVRVRVFDNLSREGSEENLKWLQRTWGRGAFEFVRGDVRDSRDVVSAVAGVDQIFHFAAQVAVTTSVTDPATDFAINAGGTLNVLNAARRLNRKPGVVYTSTNKVYGALEDIPLVRNGTRYHPQNARHANGVNESRGLDFHSPYGCSKGAADQYVRDFARIYGLPTVVFRMSCIYGAHQNGTEDQGWVAHFVARTLRNQPLFIYGDGCQVRDLLFVEDLVEAFLLVCDHLPDVAGRVFNVGGGPRNSISLIELTQVLERIHGRAARLHFKDWRPGDQRYYVSDSRALRSATGWKPRVGVEHGVTRLYEWLADRIGARVVAAKAS